MYLFLAVLGLHCCLGFSLVVESWGYFSSCSGLVITVASLASEHGLYLGRVDFSGSGGHGLSSCGSWP